MLPAKSQITSPLVRVSVRFWLLPVVFVGIDVVVMVVRASLYGGSWDVVAMTEIDVARANCVGAPVNWVR